MYKLNFKTREQLEHEKEFCWRRFEQLGRIWHETKDEVFLIDGNMYAKEAREIAEALRK